MVSSKFKDTAIPIECKSCSKEFRPNRSDQIYCSKSCRMAKYTTGKPYSEKVCPLCDTTFTPNHAAKIYCSTTCYNQYRSALYVPSNIRPFITEFVMERDGYKCQDCNVDIPKVRDKYNHGYLHHIVPLLSGGTDNPSNMILLCSDCHSKRHKRIREAHTRSNKASKKVSEYNSTSEKGLK